MSITQKNFGTTQKGETVTEFTLTNAQGASVSMIDFGGIITQICVPDREGNIDDVNLSFDEVSTYEGACGSMGALIGRVGNRIAGAHFTLDGVDYPLTANNGANNLHGGPEGFNVRMWDATTKQEEGKDTLHLHLVSPHMDQGFPGTLTVDVDYTWNDKNELGIHYQASTDQTTIINLTNHAYFNLDGYKTPTVFEQELQIFANYLTDTTIDLIPNGKFVATEGLLYGFEKPTRLGDLLADVAQNAKLLNAGGVDFNYCAGRENESKTIAKLYSPNTGRMMEVITDQPGVQCYTGQYMDKIGKNGTRFGAFSGICLETQRYPDAIHHDHFPSIVIRPEEKYDTFTRYCFSVQ